MLQCCSLGRGRSAGVDAGTVARVRYGTARQLVSARLWKRERVTACAETRLV